MKIRIIDPNGVHFGGKIIPQGEVIELGDGPHTQIWLRFKQAEKVKAKAETPVANEDKKPNPDSGKKAPADEKKK